MRSGRDNLDLDIEEREVPKRQSKCMLIVCSIAFGSARAS